MALTKEIKFINFIKLSLYYKMSSIIYYVISYILILLDIIIVYKYKYKIKIFKNKL